MFIRYTMSKKKGDRRERNAKTILECAGYNVETPNSTPYHQQKVDFFEQFDFIAVRPDKPVLFGQVKANGARGITSFSKKCVNAGIPFDRVNVEFWVCYDNEGWRILEISEDNYKEVYDERDDSGKVLHSRADDDGFNELPHHN